MKRDATLYRRHGIRCCTQGDGIRAGSFPGILVDEHAPKQDEQDPARPSLRRKYTRNPRHNAISRIFL